jgi:hypothetical protein
MIMILSMGWDYVSKLRLQTGLFFISQLIQEQGETWWNDIDRGKLIRPPDLWQSYQHRRPVANQEKMPKKQINLALQRICVHTSKGSLTCRKILLVGVNGFTSPSKEVVLRIVIAVKNPSPSDGFESAKLWSFASTLTSTPPRITAHHPLRQLIWKISSGYVHVNRLLARDRPDYYV